MTAPTKCWRLAKEMRDRQFPEAFSFVCTCQFMARLAARFLDQSSITLSSRLKVLGA
jgi:hypothetical protein